MKTYPTGAFAQSLIEYQRLRIETMQEELHRLTEENSRLRNLTLSLEIANFALASEQTANKPSEWGSPQPPDAYKQTEATAMATTISYV
jgi:hypothetical protein